MTSILTLNFNKQAGLQHKHSEEASQAIPPPMGAQGNPIEARWQNAMHSKYEYKQHKRAQATAESPPPVCRTSQRQGSNVRRAHPKRHPLDTRRRGMPSPAREARAANPRRRLGHAHHEVLDHIARAKREVAIGAGAAIAHRLADLIAHLVEVGVGIGP